MVNIFCNISKYIVIIWKQSLHLLNHLIFFDRVQTLRCWLILISRLVTEELFCPIAANETNELFLNVQVFHLHALFTAVISTERETITVSTKQTDLW